MGSDTMVLVFWMLSFKPTFLLSCFTFIKRHISYLLSAISVVLSVYLRLLKFLPAILIPAFASSSAAFLMMYSVYKLNKQNDCIQPWRTLFPIWNQSVVPRLVLTVQAGCRKGRRIRDQIAGIHRIIEKARVLWCMRLNPFLLLRRTSSPNHRHLYQVRILCRWPSRFVQHCMYRGGYGALLSIHFFFFSIVSVLYFYKIFICIQF